MAKQTGNIAGKVEEMVRPVIENLGLRLWDVRFEKEGPSWFLRVLIDRDTPLDTDTCETASRAIDPLLDKADLIAESYYLEVGSPGLGRRLTRKEHFQAMTGQKVKAKLIRPDQQNRQEIEGVLAGYEEGNVLLDTGQTIEAVPVQSAGYFKLCDDEDLFG